MPCVYGEGGGGGLSRSGAYAVYHVMSVDKKEMHGNLKFSNKYYK